jgi:hypothetical protein
MYIDHLKQLICLLKMSDSRLLICLYTRGLSLENVETNQDNLVRSSRSGQMIQSPGQKLSSSPSNGHLIVDSPVHKELGEVRRLASWEELRDGSRVTLVSARLGSADMGDFILSLSVGMSR